MPLISRAIAQGIGATDLSTVELYPADPLESVPDLAQADTAMDGSRKATVIQAVRGGWVSIEEDMRALQPLGG